MVGIPVALARKSVRHLKKNDPVLRPVIESIGPCGLTVASGQGFAMLVRSILSQQLSTKVANTLRRRLDELVEPHGCVAERLAECTVAELRAIGLSNRKAEYIIGIAEASLSGDIVFDELAALSDSEVIEKLTALRGVGIWTAKMHLMFALGRPDVLPFEDLGIRMAIRNLYGLEELPGPEDCERVAAAWRPYASIASWYCWRSLDAVPNK